MGVLLLDALLRRRKEKKIQCRGKIRCCVLFHGCGAGKKGGRLYIYISISIKTGMDKELFFCLLSLLINYYYYFEEQ